MKAFFCLSLFAFLGIHSRTLPSLSSPHIQTTAFNKWTSIFAATHKMTHRANPTHPSSHADHPTNHYDIIKRPQKAAPPPPYVAPPHSQTNAYHQWNSIFAIHGRTPADTSHPSPQVAPQRPGGGPKYELKLCYCWLSTRKIYQATKFTRSSAPPPCVTPQNIETSAYCATGSLCSQSVAAI